MVSYKDYSIIPSSEPSQNSEFQNLKFDLKRKNRLWISPTRKIFFLFAGLLLLVFILFGSIRYSNNHTTTRSNICTTPIIRREWRTLTDEEKTEYFRAVNCLRTKPSRLGTNHSLYDDFGYLHIKMAMDHYTHETAEFLAWHRYFIHVYENGLKEECDYIGHLVYWDWELDWEDIENAPVWDSENGFGGNGAGDPSVGEGRCVIDGPFANMTLYFYEGGEEKHCLSRGFRKGVEKEEFVTLKLRPEALQKIFDLQEYRTFNLALEDGAHRAIPAFLQGEFGSFTAPNDPIFFLHHTQLDRLWWKWQQVEPQRATDYYGKAGAKESYQEASINDLLYFGDLAPSVLVSDIMSTETELLCYIY